MEGETDKEPDLVYAEMDVLSVLPDDFAVAWTFVHLFLDDSINLRI